MDCGGEFSLTARATEADEVMEGELQCAACGSGYPIFGGVPRFTADTAYTRTFSFQWRVHRRDLIDSLAGHGESRRAFAEKTGLTAANLRGRLALDVGCGAGRYMESAADQGAEVIGIDLSYAVEAAFANVGRRPGYHIVQADMFRLPFRRGLFDAIFSIGVLHHTPSTQDAFSSLVPYLKPGGTIAIWVYPYLKRYTQRLDAIRRVTVRMPYGLLYALCWLTLPPLLALYQIPVVRRAVSKIPFSRQGRGLAWDVRDTFDAYAPRYQWKHTEPEVVGWFRQRNFEAIEVLTAPVAVRGRKPLQQER
jgi:SAM-dependent methyltransferase